MIGPANGARKPAGDVLGRDGQRRCRLVTSASSKSRSKTGRKCTCAATFDSAFTYGPVHVARSTTLASIGRGGHREFDISTPPTVGRLPEPCTPSSPSESSAAPRVSSLLRFPCLAFLATPIRPVARFVRWRRRPRLGRLSFKDFASHARCTLNGRGYIPPVRPRGPACKERESSVNVSPVSNRSHHGNPWRYQTTRNK